LVPRFTCETEGYFMTDTTIETPRRPFAVRDAIPLVLGLGLFATGALLFVLDVANGPAFGLAFVGNLMLIWFGRRESRRKGLPNGGYHHHGFHTRPSFGERPLSLTDPTNPAGLTSPASPIYIHRH